MRGAMVRLVGVVVMGLMTANICGCVPLAIGYAGYAISSSKGEAADKEAESRLVDSYTRYKAEAEKANLERQKMGMKTEPVKSFAEWKVDFQSPKPVEDKSKNVEAQVKGEETQK